MHIFVITQEILDTFFLFTNNWFFPQFCTTHNELKKVNVFPRNTAAFATKF